MKWRPTTKEKQRGGYRAHHCLDHRIDHWRARPAGAPGKQNIPLWLTLLVGVAAALLGTALAAGLGVANTPGIDWIEIFIQVALAAVGVTTVAGIYSRRGART